MIPVDQTIFTTALEGPPGNCFAACLASLLEVELESVPQWGWTESDGEVIAVETWPTYEARVFAWLRKLGFYYREVDVPMTSEFKKRWIPECGLHLRTGPSPRTNGETDHCCVFDGLELVHDPTLSRKGLLPAKSHQFGFLVPLDPAQFRALGNP